MVGLTFHDTLILSQPQCWAIYTNSILSLFMARRHASKEKHILLFMWYIFSLWIIFAGVQIGSDVKITWSVIPRLTPLSGSSFLSELAFVNYLKLQPPLWSWWVSRFANYSLHQNISLCLGSALWAMMAYRHGFFVAWIVASAPLFQLLILQPSNDIYALFFLFTGVLCYEEYSRVLGVFLVIFSTYWKYTVYAAIPFLIPTLRWNIVWVFVGIGGYWWWAYSTGLLWYTVQSRHYAKIFSFGFWTSKNIHKVKASEDAVNWAGRKMIRAIHWRWKHIAKQSVSALWWYALPWGTIMTWRMVGFSVCVFLGYGNIKYLSLCLLFLPMKFRNNESQSEIPIV